MLINSVKRVIQFLDNYSSLQYFFANKNTFRRIVNDVVNTDLISNIENHKSTTKGLLSNSLMINNIVQNRSFQNNWSPHINHKRTFYKNSNVIILPQKTNWKKEITYQLGTFSILMNDIMCKNRCYHNNWSPNINHKRTIFDITKD